MTENKFTLQASPDVQVSAVLAREFEALETGNEMAKLLRKRMLDWVVNPHGDLGPKIKCWMEGDRICSEMEIPPGVLADHVVLSVEG